MSGTIYAFSGHNLQCSYGKHELWFNELEILSQFSQAVA